MVWYYFWRGTAFGWSNPDWNGNLQCERGLSKVGKIGEFSKTCRNESDGEQVGRKLDGIGGIVFLYGDQFY